MVKSVEKSAKTVQEAILLALDELNVDESRVDIEVLDEGNKGLLGFIGSKNAKVRVTLKETGSIKAKKFLEDVLNKMNVDAEINVEEENDTVLYQIKGKDIGIIIGRRGETLDALQYLSSLIVNKAENTYKRVIIDTENYRQKREETLEKLAKKLADRVSRTKKSITLERMNPYERRIIHSTLQNNKYIRTYSIGDEPNRKVVITTK